MLGEDEHELHWVESQSRTTSRRRFFIPKGAMTAKIGLDILSRIPA
jgi:hypothetical protein